MLLAIDSFRLKFPEAREGPRTVFYRNSSAATRQTPHAAAWLIIIWDAVRFAGRALWRIDSLIFLRSSLPADIAA
jgi:hypothetical protein